MRFINVLCQLLSCRIIVFLSPFLPLSLPSLPPSLTPSLPPLPPSLPPSLPPLSPSLLLYFLHPSRSPSLPSSLFYFLHPPSLPPLPLSQTLGKGAKKVAISTDEWRKNDVEERLSHSLVKVCVGVSVCGGVSL